MFRAMCMNNRGTEETIVDNLLDPARKLRTIINTYSHVYSYVYSSARASYMVITFERYSMYLHECIYTYVYVCMLPMFHLEGVDMHVHSYVCMNGVYLCSLI